MTDQLDLEGPESAAIPTLNTSTVLLFKGSDLTPPGFSMERYPNLLVVQDEAGVRLLTLDAQGTVTLADGETGAVIRRAGCAMTNAALVMNERQRGTNDRLRASEARVKELEETAEERDLSDAEVDQAFKDLDAKIASQAETIRGLIKTLKLARNQVVAFAIDTVGADAAVKSVSYIDAALSRTPAGSGEARPDTGSDGGEGV